MMKISTIMRMVSQLIFWAVAVVFFTWLLKLNDSNIMCILTIYATMGACFLARLPVTMKVTFAMHLTCTSIPVISEFTDKTGPAVMLFCLAYIIMSFITKRAKKNYMNRAHAFQQFVIIVFYLLAAVAEYKHIYIMYAALFLYTFIHLMQLSVERNEEYVGIAMKTSTTESDRFARTGDLISILVIAVMMLLCALLSLLGKAAPFAAISAGIKSKFIFLYNAIKNIAFTEGSVSSVKEEVTTAYFEQTTAGYDESIFNSEDTTAGTIRLIVIMVIIVVLLDLYIYRWVKHRKPKNTQEEEISVHIQKEKKPKKVNPRKTDPSYGNRKAARRLYKKRVKGGKSGQRQDLETRTPYEQRTKANENGIDISGEFVDMYERARYSNQKVTKEDVKKMQNL